MSHRFQFRSWVLKAHTVTPLWSKCPVHLSSCCPSSHWSQLPWLWMCRAPSLSLLVSLLSHANGLAALENLVTLILFFPNTMPFPDESNGLWPVVLDSRTKYHVKSCRDGPGGTLLQFQPLRRLIEDCKFKTSWE